MKLTQNTITTADAKKLIFDNQNKIFSIEFIKKDNTRRLMVARLGVKKGVKGIGQSFEPSKYNLITAFDMQKSAFRMINCNNLLKLVLKNKTYIINN